MTTALILVSAYAFLATCGWRAEYRSARRIARERDDLRRGRS